MEDQLSTMTPKQQTVDRLKNSLSIVIALSKQPTTEDFASAIGLSYILRRFGKKATIISSTVVPAELNFLGPGELVSKKIDHLRDFVIELDKEKADKLRYKPDNNVVKIFITPYRDEITQSDLRFSQGDYNVDTVIVIGVGTHDELDPVLKNHEDMLKVATTISLTSGEKTSNLGMVNWQEPAASSVAEMLVSIADALQGGLLDQEASQVLLAALVAATDRFHNHKTTPKVMTIAAQLIAAGADPQTVMNQFENPSARPIAKPATRKQDPSSLEISHDNRSKSTKGKPQQPQKASAQPAPLPPASSIPPPLPAKSPSPAPAQPLPPMQSLPATLPPATPHAAVPSVSTEPIEPMPSNEMGNIMQVEAGLPEMPSAIPLMNHHTPKQVPLPTSSVSAPPVPMIEEAPAAGSYIAPQVPVTAHAPVPALNPVPTVPTAFTTPSPAPQNNPPTSVEKPAPEPIQHDNAAELASLAAARQAVQQAVSKEIAAVAPGSAPPAQQNNQDILVAPDGTLQYATPSSNQTSSLPPTQ